MAQRVCDYLEFPSWLRGLTSIHEESGLIPNLAQWLNGLRIQPCCELWYRWPTWCRWQIPHCCGWDIGQPAGIAWIQRLDWELTYAVECGPKGKKKKKKKEKEVNDYLKLECVIHYVSFLKVDFSFQFYKTENLSPASHFIHL